MSDKRLSRSVGSFLPPLALKSTFHLFKLPLLLSRVLVVFADLVLLTKGKRLVLGALSLPLVQYWLGFSEFLTQFVALRLTL